MKFRSNKPIDKEIAQDLTIMISETQKMVGSLIEMIKGMTGKMGNKVGQR